MDPFHLSEQSQMSLIATEPDEFHLQNFFEPFILMEFAF